MRSVDAVLPVPVHLLMMHFNKQLVDRWQSIEHDQSTVSRQDMEIAVGVCTL